MDAHAPSIHDDWITRGAFLRGLSLMQNAEKPVQTVCDL